MSRRLLGILAAIFVHAAILLFGGLLFIREDEEKQEVREVDLLAEAEPEKKQEPEKEKDPEETSQEEAVETLQDTPPDMVRELARLESEAAAAPALEALSLGDLSSLLDPSQGAGAPGFGGSFGLQSGGRIGGTGAVGEGGGGAQEGAADSVFGLTELDEKPRPLYQPSPVYPHELRSRRAAGTVYVLFVVDQAGKVMDPRVETSTHQAFEKPALEAVRQWKFEPATRQGQKVSCRIRVPIRFTA